MPIQKLSSKNQIVIPKEARQAMKLRAGDEILVVAKGDITIIMRKPESYVRELKGSGRGLYAKSHVGRERGAW